MGAVPTSLRTGFRARRLGAGQQAVCLPISKSLSPCAEPATSHLREQLLVYSRALFPEFASSRLGVGGPAAPAPTWPAQGSAAAAFHAWAEEQGIQAAIGVADFGGLRGCAAKRTIEPGELVLSVPQQALIYEDTVAETDLVSCHGRCAFTGQVVG